MTRREADGGDEDDSDREATATALVAGAARPRSRAVRGYAVTWAAAPPGVTSSWRVAGDHVRIGSHAANDVVVDDRTVSRFHAELRDEAGEPIVEDVGSRNGVVVDGVRARLAWLRDGAELTLGDVHLTVRLLGDAATVEMSPETSLGTLVGASDVMRTLFATVARCAASDATVLLQGETGTGKEGVAEALHQRSVRADGPFVVVDCGAIAPSLLESELFGHERGAFTGAVAQREGAFEAAHGGTIFLDEIGELSAEMQPKLLRVLERKEVRRVGRTDYTPVDVRVVAATHRELEREVNEGRFRPDLYFRLAVLRVPIPPLRARLDDLPLLVPALLARIGASKADVRRLSSPVFLGRLSRESWPGNVRELRNYLERALVLGDEAPAAGDAAATTGTTYHEARRRALDAFERSYFERLLEAHGGNVAAAARAADVDRVHVHRMLKRHGLR